MQWKEGKDLRLTCANNPLFMVTLLVTTNDDTPPYTHTYYTRTLWMSVLCVCPLWKYKYLLLCELSPWRKPPWTSERYTSLLLVLMSSTTDQPCPTLSHPPSCQYLQLGDESCECERLRASDRLWLLCLFQPQIIMEYPATGGHTIYSRC